MSAARTTGLAGRPDRPRGGAIAAAVVLHAGLACWGAAVPAAGSATTVAPQVPVAFPAQQADVFASARIDGQPVRTRALRLAEPAAVALESLVRGWGTAPDQPVVRAQADGWRIASRLTGEGYETVQLRDAAGGGSEGFASVWGRAARAAQAKPDWLPAQALWSRRIESRDGAHHAVTTVALLPGAVQPAWRAVSAAAAAQGWQPDAADAARMRPAAQAAARDGRAIALLRRGPHQLLLTLAASPQGAALVAHQTEIAR